MIFLLRPPWQQAGQGVDINSVASHTGRQGGAKEGEGGEGGLHYVITVTVVQDLPHTVKKLLVCP